MQTVGSIVGTMKRSIDAIASIWCKGRFSICNLTFPKRQVAVAGVLGTLVPEFPLAAGAILLFGSLGVLVENMTRAARH
jgi:hypothetical protein